MLSMAGAVVCTGVTRRKFPAELRLAINTERLGHNCSQFGVS